MYMYQPKQVFVYRLRLRLINYCLTFSNAKYVAYREFKKFIARRSKQRMLTKVRMTLSGFRDAMVRTLIF